MMLEKLLKLVRVINNPYIIPGVIALNDTIPVPLMLFYAKALLSGMERLDRSIFWLSSTQRDPSALGIRLSKIGRSTFTPPGSALTYFLRNSFCIA
jgi:hypothetical protein